jgi:hypothetical protein
VKILWLVGFCLVGLVFVAFGVYLYGLVTPQHLRIITEGGLKLAGIAFVVSGAIIIAAGIVGYVKNAY